MLCRSNPLLRSEKRIFSHHKILLKPECVQLGIGIFQIGFIGYIRCPEFEIALLAVPIFYYAGVSISADTCFFIPCSFCLWKKGQVMKAKGETPKIRKTSAKHRETYTYITTDGNKLILRPGENGVTEVHIKILHAMDDAEVYNNIKNGRPEPTEKEKQQIQEWKRQHPDEKLPQNWNLSLDATIKDEENGDTLGDIVAAPVIENNPNVDRLRETVATMTERQQQVYQLHLLEGFSVKETAAILGISSPAVTEHKKRIIEIIKKNFEGG